MIVGTAGHIDHGKSSLVRALTGVDTDRLPEEKQRGISIELGYAFMDLAGEGGSAAEPATAGEPAPRIGFIDVPGHERLVHTMVAGATGIDLGLLVVAADDGVMPQTLEHLAVLALLGLARGAVVITKTDRAGAGRVAALAAELPALLAGTPLAGSPVWPVSAVTGEGLPALKDWLRQQALALEAPEDDARTQRAFRLAVDRVFSLPGAGTVVTGTVHAGQVRVGDELRLAPAGHGAQAQPLLARVRSVHAQNRQVAVARAGQRCALALAGLAREQVARGQWLVAPAAWLGTERLDARLTLWRDEAKPLRSGQPVQLHIGAASVQASVAVLAVEQPGAEPTTGHTATDHLAPGQTGLVQLVLRLPLGAWHGDRVVLRDASASRTLAGGRVLDPQAPQRYRRTPERLAALAALALPGPVERVRQLLQHAPQGLSVAALEAAQGQALPWPPEAQRHGDAVLAPDHAQAARAALLAAVAASHAREPEALGPELARLRRLATPRLPQALFQGLVQGLLAQGRLVQRGAYLHLPEHAVTLSQTEQRIAQKVAPQLTHAGFEGAWARDLARASGEPEALVRSSLSRLAQRGEMHQVVKDLFYDLPTMERLCAITLQVAQGSDSGPGQAQAPMGEVTAARFRDATQLGRKRAIQILEYLDRIGLLRRLGDAHRVRADSALLPAAGAASTSNAAPTPEIRA